MDKQLPRIIENYDDACHWIFDRINYERIRPRSSSGHFRLERIERQLELIGSPQNRIPAVHIAGTKGKGSTSAILDSILRESEIRCGLFTSPHIHLFEERMQVNGRMPNESELTDMVRELNELLSAGNSEFTADGPTYFEVATLLAWMFFDRQQTEFVVLETGLGGRLDCTNVCQPLVTIITTIGLDHTHILGDTIEKIAAEKAGIIKRQVPVMTWALQPGVLKVICDRSESLNCSVYMGDRDIRVTAVGEVDSDIQTVSVTTPWRVHNELQLPLMGEHQQRNAALAIAAADALATNQPPDGSLDVDMSGITADSIRNGVANVRWPLRFEKFVGEPTIVLDAAHNPDAVEAFAKTFQSWSESRRNSVLIFASSEDKDAEGMLIRLAPLFDQIVLTVFETNPRATSTGRLNAILLNHRRLLRRPENVYVADGPTAALELASNLATRQGVICVTGSIFIASEVRSLLIKEHNDGTGQSP